MLRTLHCLPRHQRPPVHRLGILVLPLAPHCIRQVVHAALWGPIDITRFICVCLTGDSHSGDASCKDIRDGIEVDGGEENERKLGGKERGNDNDKREGARDSNGRDFRSEGAIFRDNLVDPHRAIRKVTWQAQYLKISAR
ncbi:MAG: hypothetical protein MMC33_007204 [Icmadophila ericetorum]|nr:hypothetical protein [Icmadophila ericetorum]